MADTDGTPETRPSVQLGVFAAAVGVFFVSSEVVTPLVRGHLLAWIDQLDRGPRLLLGHWLSYSLTTALISGVAWALMCRFARLPLPVLIGPSPRAACRWGAIIGVSVSTVTAALWAFIGPGFQVDVDFWKMGGNLLSNFYEEWCYRGLLLTAALFAFRGFWPAAVVSQAIFGFTHTQYPPFFRVFTALVGVAFAYAARLSGGALLAPYVAHEIADTLLDTFLKT